MKGQFRGKNLSRHARRAAYALGMKRVESYDILNHEALESLVQRAPEAVVIRLYGPKGQVLDLTAADLREALVSLEPGASPMARV